MAVPYALEKLVLGVKAGAAGGRHTQAGGNRSFCHSRHACSSAHCQVPGFQFSAWCQNSSLLTTRYQGSSLLPGSRIPVQCLMPELQLTAWCQSCSSLPGTRVPGQCLVPELRLTARYHGSSSLSGARAPAHCWYQGSSSVPDARASAHWSSLPVARAQLTAR